MLGHLGATLEWHETDRCQDEAGVGQEHDLERVPPSGGTESPSVPTGREVEQEGDGGGGGPLDTRSEIAPVRHFDPTGFHSLNEVKTFQEIALDGRGRENIDSLVRSCRHRGKNAV